jgi:hypothetical protein
MFAVVLFALAAATPPDRAYPEAEPDRAAIDQAIKRQLIGSGYFQLVTDQGERRSVIAGFQKRLRSLGIPATVGECDWVGLVAQGFANSNDSYGAACRVRIGAKPASPFLICDASLGGISLVKPDWYAFDAQYIEIFIRRTCL